METPIDAPSHAVFATVGDIQTWPSVISAIDVATRLTLVFEGRPKTLAARLLMPLGLLFAGTVRRQLASDLADLEREAARRHRDGAPRSA